MRQMHEAGGRHEPIERSAGGQPSLRQLEVLVAVAEAGGFSAAAQRLGLQQSSVSRAVRELETVLDVRLFLRGPAGTQITAAGHRIIAGARRLLALVDDLPDLARDRPAGGTVRIGAFRTAAVLLLPPVAARLAAAHPTITLQIRSLREIDGGVGAAIAAGTCDVGLTSLPTDPELVSIALTEDPYVRVEPASDDHDLAELPFLHWNESCSDRAIAWLTASGTPPRRTLQAEDEQVVLALVGGGVGWSLMPAFAARPKPSDVRLRALKGSPTRTIGVCAHPAGLARPAVRAVFDAISESVISPA
ncbi:MAG: LysR family transcriptional regulator [Solirubrobacterales bacterium]|nr:LysR family transcriptional regulator [Solirubrobacterales bacterium]